LLAPRTTPKLEDHLLSAVHNCLFNIFAATLHIGGCSSICKLRTHHAMVTGTQLSHGLIILQSVFKGSVAVLLAFLCFQIYYLPCYFNFISGNDLIIIPVSLIPLDRFYSKFCNFSILGLLLFLLTTYSSLFHLQ